MATAAVRSTLSKAPVGVLPPASPFAELLRRSRFASYDPEIRQTYSAPPAYAQRGNWGLKRPISQRNKDAYITLKSYEDHAQYVEWNNAGAEVRFVKQFEELNMAPTNTTESIQNPFFNNLGPIQNSIWLTDSEFDVAPDSDFKFSLAEEEAAEVEKAPGAFDDLDFSKMGKRGKGSYGAKMDVTVTGPLKETMLKPWNYRQPNIEAMNEAEFEAYLKKLRELRPKFLEEIKQVHGERLRKQELKSTLLDGDVSDLQLAATNCVNNDHKAFLNHFFEKQFEERDTSPSAPDPNTLESLPNDFVRPTIKPQPHRFGGLMYSHPSLLDTLYTTEARPAFALSYAKDGNKDEGHNRGSQNTLSKNDFLQASFGGFSAKVDGKIPGHVKPLFYVHSGPKEDALRNSLFPEVRPKTMSILEAPNVVGKNTKGLHGTSIKEIIVPDQSPASKGWDNSQRPGTFAYSAAFPGHMPHVSMSLHRTPSKSAYSNKRKAAAAMGKIAGMLGTTPKP